MIKKNGLNPPLRNISSELFKEGRKDFSVFSPENRAQLLRANESFYQYLGQRYLSNKDSSFFRNLSVHADEQWSSYQLTKEDAHYIGACLKKKYVNGFNILLEGLQAGIISTDMTEKNAALLLMPGIFEMLTGDRKKLLAATKLIYLKILSGLRMH